MEITSNHPGLQIHSVNAWVLSVCFSLFLIVFIIGKLPQIDSIWLAGECPISLLVFLQLSAISVMHCKEMVCWKNGVLCLALPFCALVRYTYVILLKCKSLHIGEYNYLFNSDHSDCVAGVFMWLKGEMHLPENHLTER